MALGDGSLQQAASDAATSSNIKVVSEGPAFWTNMMYKDALEDARSLSVVRIAAVGDIVQSMNDRSQESDAVSGDRLLNGNFSATTLMQLAAALSAAGQGNKTLDNTPPIFITTPQSVTKAA